MKDNFGACCIELDREDSWMSCTYTEAVRYARVNVLRWSVAIRKMDLAQFMCVTYTTTLIEVIFICTPLPTNREEFLRFYSCISALL